MLTHRVRLPILSLSVNHHINIVDGMENHCV